MTDDQTETGDRLFADLRGLPATPLSAALSARVLARAHAALETNRRPAAVASTWAVGSAVVAAVAVYLTWAVEFLARLAST